MLPAGASGTCGWSKGCLLRKIAISCAPQWIGKILFFRFAAYFDSIEFVGSAAQGRKVYQSLWPYGTGRSKVPLSSTLEKAKARGLFIEHCPFAAWA